MWFPNEIFSQIKDFMLDYKKTFRRNILPSIGLLKPSIITTAGPRFKATDFSSGRYIYEVLYKVPRLENLSEERLNKLGLTHYGPNANKKDEKRYLYLYCDDDWLNLEGWRKLQSSRFGIPGNLFFGRSFSDVAW